MAELSTNFVAVDVEIHEAPALAHQYGVLWTPHIVILNDRGTRVREFEGFVGPDEMLAHLRLGRGSAELRRLEPGKADMTFSQAERDAPMDELRAEAMFWRGIARYHAARDKAVLWREWRALVDRFPRTTWAERTTYLHGGGPGVPGRAPRGRPALTSSPSA